MTKDTILEHPDSHHFWTNGLTITPVQKATVGTTKPRWYFDVDCTSPGEGLSPSRKTKKATVALRNAYITFLKSQGWIEDE